MHEYRERMTKKTGDVAQSVSSATNLDDTPKYMSLAEQYGIAEEMEIGMSEHTQTIEQEFQAYVTSTLSPKNIDILKFWEVGGQYCIDNY